MADLKLLHDKFFTDPSWADMEELIMEYIEPFKSVLNIPEGLSNDQIATEVRGRQKMVEQLERFLTDSKVITRRITRGETSYR